MIIFLTLRCLSRRLTQQKAQVRDLDVKEPRRKKKLNKKISSCAYKQMELFLSNVIHHFHLKSLPQCFVFRSFIHEIKKNPKLELLLPRESAFLFPYVNNLNILSKCYHLTLMDYVCRLVSWDTSSKIYFQISSACRPYRQKRDFNEWTPHKIPSRTNENEWKNKPKHLNHEHALEPNSWNKDSRFYTVD